MLENLKRNVRNKAWWVSVISLLIVLCQSHGVDLTKIIGVDWQSTLNTIFGLAVLFGISVDTTATNTAIKENSQDGQVTTSDTESKANSSSDISNNVQVSSNASNLDTSASSKVKVDNPDNIQEAGIEVNAKAATSPSAAN